MTSKDTDLARRAIACERWKWCYGMLALFPATPKDPEGYKVRIADDTDARNARMDEALPDLRDPATIGCLFALVREAWQDPFLILRGYPASGSLPEVWRRLHHGNRIMENGEADTEAAALISALEDAAKQPKENAR